MALQKVWADARAWFVGHYLVMPDHVHLFAAPGEIDIEIEAWVKYWKSQLAKSGVVKRATWQNGCWHHRLRDGKEYEEKLQYVFENPVRAGLVQEPETWPYQGEIESLKW